MELATFFRGKFVKVVPDEEQLIISKALENYIYELEKEVQELKRESFRCLICEKKGGMI